MKKKHLRRDLRAAEARAAEMERFWLEAHSALAVALATPLDMLCPEPTDSAAAIYYMDAARAHYDNLQHVKRNVRAAGDYMRHLDRIAPVVIYARSVTWGELKTEFADHWDEVLAADIIVGRNGVIAHDHSEAGQQKPDPCP